jgi:PHP family Zn ribbon phosphoesterase
MKFYYDLHIHSGLSPCADNSMTPINIVAAASAKGLEIIAISDHNSIRNVKLAMEIGKMLDVLVVPAIELQTNEDIHILCLFDTYQNLEKFYNSIKFSSLENKKEIFGDQYVFDGDDNVIDEEKSLLIAGADISEREVLIRAKKYNGIAIPAHVDRDAFGMLSTLGDIPSDYTTIERTNANFNNLGNKYSKRFNIIYDSDAHVLEEIGKNMKNIELSEKNAIALIRKLMVKKR